MFLLTQTSVATRGPQSTNSVKGTEPPDIGIFNQSTRWLSMIIEFLFEIIPTRTFQSVCCLFFCRQSHTFMTLHSWQIIRRYILHWRRFLPFLTLNTVTLWRLFQNQVQNQLGGAMSWLVQAINSRCITQPNKTQSIQWVSASLVRRVIVGDLWHAWDIGEATLSSLLPSCLYVQGWYSHISLTCEAWLYSSYLQINHTPSQAPFHFFKTGSW